MEKRIYEMDIEQRYTKIGDVVISSDIYLEIDNQEDVEVITNLIMKYGKGKVTVTTKRRNYVEESEE